MPSDFYKKPFSQETITKLDIFEAYLQSWLPVFIHSPYYNEINICDFFAGEGQDSEANLGSPLRILKVLEEYKDSINESRLKVNLVFNEFQIRKFNDMKRNVQPSVEKSNMGSLLQIEYYNDDFQKLFHSKANQIRDMPNLIFLDQYGIKQVTQDIFSVLESFKRTDFMYFIASSFFNRFADTKQSKKYFPDLDMNREIPAKDIHRVIIEYYRGKLPAGSKTRLYPFTIKKAQNIYGLIFGSKHVLGVKNFLEVAWGQNNINGEANFDIDNDIGKQQDVLFPEMKKKTKKELFYDEVKQFIVKSEVVTNKQLYDYALENGFLPIHIAEIVRDLRDKELIQFKGHAKITYEKCYKNPDVIKFEAIK